MGEARDRINARISGYLDAMTEIIREAAENGTPAPSDYALAEVAGFDSARVGEYLKRGAKEGRFGIEHSPKNMGYRKRRRFHIDGLMTDWTAHSYGRYKTTERNCMRCKKKFTTMEDYRMCNECRYDVNQMSSAMGI